MPRGSRRRSHRSRKHSRDPSDSEEEESMRDSRSREDEPSARVSRNLESEKRRSSHAHERKEALVISNSDVSGDYGKKRKARAEDLVADADRWNVDEDNDHKRAKSEDFAESLVGADAKSSGSSRRHEDSSERNEERSGKIESTKRKSEKDLSRRESSRSQYKDGKERDRERVSENEQYKDAKKKDRELVSESGHYKDGKERERERRSESGQCKDMKDRERECGTESGQYKDGKESDRERRKESDQFKDVRERDREQGLDSRKHKDVGERDRERGSERDKERGSRRDRERGSGRDKERTSEREKGRGLERDRERGFEKERDRDRDARDASHERDDLPSRKHGAKVGSSEEEHMSRKDRKMNETQVQDVVPNPELEKGLEKPLKKRDNSEGKDKWLVDSRDGDDKRLSSRDDHTKSRSSRDERHEDAKPRGKYIDDHDERSTRDPAAYKCDNKHFRDENKPLDGRYKRSKMQDNHDGNSYSDDYEVRLKDSTGRKRYSDENEVYNELNFQGVKGPREDIEKNITKAGVAGFRSDKPRPEYRHSDMFDSSPRNNGQKGSASSNAYTVKEQNRDSSKQADFAQRESSSEERIRPSAASSGRLTASVVHSRVSGTRSERMKPKADANSSEIYGETVASVKYERTSRPDSRTSPNQRKERSPSFNSDRRISERTGHRRHLDVEVGQKSSTLNNEGRGQSILEKPILDEGSQNEAYNWESTPAGSSSIDRTGYMSLSSPNHLPPHPLMRPGFDSPSVLGSLDDDNRSQIGDRRPYSRYKRSGDIGYGRGHANAWKTAPAWPSPMGNGFLPVQHGPPGYHSAVPQFPGPPLFGVRPSMDLAHSGVSFHMHDVTDSFSGHGRTFGWPGAVDQPCPPHMQVWDGRNGVFGDESHMFRRSDWDQNRHLLGTRGWEMGADLWKGQNGNFNVDIPAHKKETEGLKHPVADEIQIRQPGHQSDNRRPGSECLPTESVEAKRSSGSPPATNVAESSVKLVTKKGSEPSDVAHDQVAKYWATYLSRIDLSPVLANPELYEKYNSILKTSNINSASTFASNQRSLSVEDGGLVKTKGTSQMSRSLFPTAKDSIFQRAMSLYKKQREISKVNSSEDTKGSPEATDNKEAKEVGEIASLEEEDTLADVIPASDIEAGNNIVNGADPGCPATPDDKLSDCGPDYVIYANDSQACESLMEDCKVNLSRIHNSPESTH